MSYKIPTVSLMLALANSGPVLAACPVPAAGIADSNANAVCINSLNDRVGALEEAGGGNTTIVNEGDTIINEGDTVINESDGEGTAIALASRIPTLSDGESFAVSGAFGNFDSSSAFGFGFTARVEGSLQAFGTVGVSEGGKVGSSVGMQFAW